MKLTTKLSLVAGLAVGYVLGARAGRERYDQIAAGAARVWGSKPVQRQVQRVAGLVDRYVPQFVETGFTVLGKGASGLTRLATQSRARAAQQPTGTVDSPAS